MTRGLFPATRPSAIADLLSGDAKRRARSLDVVMRAYWRPVYKHVRLRWSKPAAHAEDLTQSFFELALERDLLASYQPGRGRFRTFLRACLDRHVIDEHRMATAARRGGAGVALDFADAEAELADPSTLDPTAVFDAEWLRHLMTLALERLDASLAERGKSIHAALFREFHLGDPAPSYADAAARHGIAVTDVTNWLHAARRAFRGIALDLLRELTVDSDDFAAEASAVFGIELGHGDRR